MFCTYVRFNNLLWFWGWHLVGMGSHCEFNGLSSEFAGRENCSLLLLEYNEDNKSPIAEWFYFQPKKTIQRMKANCSIPEQFAFAVESMDRNKIRQIELLCNTRNLKQSSNA